MAEIEAIWSDDNLTIRVPVKSGSTDGAAKDLTGGTFEAFAKPKAGSRVKSGNDDLVTGTVELSGGVLLVSFDRGDFVIGGRDYECQVRVTLEGDTQTVAAFDVPVNVSIGVQT